MSFYRMPTVGVTHGVGRVISTYCASLVTKESKIEPRLFGCLSVYDYCSGKAALVAALTALKRLDASRCEVVIPAYTCYSVAAAVEAVGLRLVLCDLIPETLDFNYEELRSVVNNNSLCIISTHFFCKSADVAQARKIADSVGAYLIEDAAQSGIEPYQGQTIPDIVLYSFGRGKPISTNGGGILAVNREDISEAIFSVYGKLSAPSRIQEFKSVLMMMLSDVLIQPPIFWLPAKLSFLGIGKTIYPEHIPVGKMGRFKLLLLREMIKRLPALRESRQANADFYANKLEKHDGVLLPPFQQKRKTYCSPIRFPCYLGSGFGLMKEKLLSKKLGISQMYPCGLHRLKRIQLFWNNSEMDFPGADWIAEHLWSLPVHPLVTKQHRSKVIGFIKGCITG